MCSVKVRTKLLLILSAPFLFFFAVGVTNFGQTFLRGDIPADTGHIKVDDIYMGAGLAPWVYGLLPFVLLFMLGLISWFRGQRKNPAESR
jgi:hypothetical protein